MSPETLEGGNRGDHPVNPLYVLGGEKRSCLHGGGERSDTREASVSDKPRDDLGPIGTVDLLQVIHKNFVSSELKSSVMFRHHSLFRHSIGLVVGLKESEKTLSLHRQKYKTSTINNCSTKPSSFLTLTVAVGQIR